MVLLTMLALLMRVLAFAFPEQSARQQEKITQPPAKPASPSPSIKVEPECDGERERAAIAIAVLLEMRKGATKPLLEPVSVPIGWKLAGRLERM